MTKEQCIGLLKRYAEYDGMGIPNLAGCKDAMRMAAELLERPSLPSNMDEAAEEYAGVNYDCETETDAFYHHIETEAFKAGSDFGAKKMLAKLKENCVIIVKDLYEIALEGKFIEGMEEGKKWMAGQFQKIEGELVDWYSTSDGKDYCYGISTDESFEVPEGFYIRKK